MTEIKTLRTPLLGIGYLEQGPADGRPVLLLHGWPYNLPGVGHSVPLE